MTEPPDFVAPALDEVHVWWIDLGVTQGEAEAILSPDEHARAARFRRLHDREHWTRARVAVRHVLAGYLRLPPQDLQFTSGTHEAMSIPPSPGSTGRVPSGRRGWGVRALRGKPALANDPRLRFNLAHAGDRAVLAVAWEREVGIDLEPIDAGLDLAPLLTAACTPAEITRLEALPPDQRIETFLALWTVKEAYLKAIGLGVFREPRALDVEFSAGGHAIVHDAHAEGEPLRWDVRLLDAGPDWVAALAAAGAAPTPVGFAWPLQR